MTADSGFGQGPALPLPDRERVLEHAEPLILSAWRNFDHHRPNQPVPDERNVELLSTPLLTTPSDPIAALDAAADVLDVSIAQSRPRFFAYLPDAVNASLARAVAADERIMLAPAEVDGGTWLRACFVNHGTTDDDVYAIPEVVAEVSEAMAGVRS